MALQHLRSSTANKRPLAAGMADGQLAMNTNTASPGLFFKDSTGALVKVGPVHVGTTAPNASPASGGGTGNTVGEQWLDTAGGTYVFKVWDGSAWRSETGTFVDVAGDVMTGALGVIAGTASAPGLYVSGDSNTGLYSPGADQLAISTAGTGRLFVDSTGSVGIGAASDSANYKLNIYNPSADFCALSIGNNVSGGGSLNGLVIAQNQANSLITNRENGYMGFSANGSERLRITSDGKVGIGTSSPSSTLHVQGTTTAHGNGAASLFWGDTSALGALTYNGTDVIIQTQSGSSGNLLFWQSTNERMRIDSSGRLGIGTSSPFTTLHSVKSITGGNPATSGTADANVFARFQGGSVGLDIGGTTGGLQWIQPRDVNNFATNYGLSLCPNGGNVGVGTSAPSTLCHISGGGLKIDQGVLADTEFTTSANWNYAGLYLRRNASNTSSAKFLSLMLQGDSSSDTTLTNQLNIWGTYSGTPTTGSTSVGLNGALNLGAPSAIVAHTNGSERARIDSSGRLLVGTSAATNVGGAARLLQLEATSAGTQGQSILVNGGTSAGNAPVFILGRSRGTTVGSTTAVAQDDTLGYLQFVGANGSDLSNIAAQITAAVDGAVSGGGVGDMPGRLVFFTTPDGSSSPVERMRINNTGFFTNFASADTGAFSTAAAAGTTVTVLSGYYGATANYTAAGTRSFLVWSNGNVQNTNNSYGAISDIKLKENIVDANSQWNDLKALQVRKYNFKEGQTHTQIGLIAQEVELVSPGLVTESPDRDADGNDLGTVTKSVNYSVLYMKAVKALQEAMERIETLEARVAALEGA